MAVTVGRDQRGVFKEASKSAQRDLLLEQIGKTSAAATKVDFRIELPSGESEPDGIGTPFEELLKDYDNL